MRWTALVVSITTLLFVASAVPVGSATCRDAGRLALVPAGPFWMASDAREREVALALSGPATVAANWFSAELARTRQDTEAFCIDRLLVTQARYAEFVKQTRHRAPGISSDEYRSQGFLVHDYDAEVRSYLWWGDTPLPGKTEHPVVLVSADDAEAFCRWQGPLSRLPSETEWEKAARGAEGRIGRYPLGASPYGMLDAVGNVFQWTASALGDGRRVLKGCAWDDDAGLCRPAFRHGRPPASRHILIGFRCWEPTAPP